MVGEVLLDGTQSIRTIRRDKQGSIVEGDLMGLEIGRNPLDKGICILSIQVFRTLHRVCQVASIAKLESDSMFAELRTPGIYLRANLRSIVEQNGVSKPHDFKMYFFGGERGEDTKGTQEVLMGRVGEREKTHVGDGVEHDNFAFGPELDEILPVQLWVHPVVFCVKAMEGRSFG